MNRNIAERNDAAEDSAGPGSHRVRFVAEIASNHGTDLGRSLAFVDAAADAGFDAVKFQLFRVDELFAPVILERSPVHRARRAWELPEAHLTSIAKRCRERQLLFSCTPFSLHAVAVLEPLVNFFKIASYELLWTDLLTACARTGHPVVLSTGMADSSEVGAATRSLQVAGCRDLTLLHCVSGYPARAAEANLAAIDTLRATPAPKPGFRLRVGWSDHTREPGVVQRAIHRYGANMIELHLDLDGKGEEFAFGHCWLPDEAARLIHDARNAALADGRAEKLPTPGEIDERSWRADPIDGLRPLTAIRSSWRP